MMRPKVFHGTNSITCANSVLPTFMRYPGSFRPASIANRRPEVQIVDTHEPLKARAGIGLPAYRPRFNRTAVVFINVFGGVDGARTRDPRRDRVGDQTSIHAGLRVCGSFAIPKTADFAQFLPGMRQPYSKVFTALTGAPAQTVRRRPTSTGVS